MKWAPEASSFRCWDFLDDLVKSKQMNEDDYVWEVKNHSKIQCGDTLFLEKNGQYGQKGIVMGAIITSNPFRDIDMFFDGPDHFYVTYYPFLMLNPDAVPIISYEMLRRAMPRGAWKNQQETILSRSDDEKFHALVKRFLKDNVALLRMAEAGRETDLVHCKEAFDYYHLTID